VPSPALRLLITDTDLPAHSNRQQAIAANRRTGVKRISPATVTFGVMAIVLGLVAAYVVRQALHKPPVAAKPQPAPEMQRVVFAKNVIPKNTRLAASDVFVSQIPKTEKLPPGVYPGVNLVVGRITKQSISAGKMLRESMFLGIDEELPNLSQRLPAGHRAVTIIVQGAETGGERLTEGDHIDLALTVEGTHPDLGEVQTRTLMQNVLVVDAAAVRPKQTTRRTTDELEGTSITVAVLPADANKLIVAQRTGTLQATLVSATEAAATPADDTVTRRQLLGLKEVAPPKKFMIEKWSGNNVRVIEMSDDRIRESREVGGQQLAPITPTTPVTKAPAGAGNEVGKQQPLNPPTGVRVPAVTYSIGEPPFAAFTSTEASAPEAK
jgi:pilus assembly protein CpaB